MTEIDRLEALRLLEQAKDLARVMHRGQEYDGKEYFYAHLAPVAQLTGWVRDDPIALAVAYLHDIIEDTPASLHMLRQLGFPPEIVWAVGYLTKLQEETYAEYIHLLTVSPGRAGEIARIVKYADLTYNRLRCLHDPNYRGLCTRYTEALAVLTPAVIADACAREVSE